MLELLLGALILAAIQVAGLAICRWAGPSDFREVRDGLLIASFWWILAPYTLASDGLRRRRYRRLRNRRGDV